MKNKFKIIVLLLITLITLMLIFQNCSEKKLDGRQVKIIFIDVSRPVDLSKFKLSKDYYYRRVEKSFAEQKYGDATLIITPEKNMLIDAGLFTKGQAVVSKILKDNNIKTINYMILTHPHGDHYGGMIELLQEFKVEKFYSSGATANTKAFKMLMSLIKEKNIKYSVPEVGTIINLGKDINLEVLKIGGDEWKGNLNNQSLVSKLTFKNFSALFTGDAEIEAENYLVNKYKTKLKSDVYQVGHHGSTTSSSYKFLKYVKPEVAVLSVGRGNKHSLPKAIVLERLKAMGMKLYPTYDYGHITLVTDGNNYKIITQYNNDNPPKKNIDIKDSSEYLKQLSLGSNATREYNFKEALIHYKKAVELNKNSSVAYSQLGYALKKLKRFDESEKAFKKSLELNPNENYALLHLGLSYCYDRNKKKEAKMLLKKYLKLNPNSKYKKLVIQKLRNLEY